MFGRTRGGSITSCLPLLVNSRAMLHKAVCSCMLTVILVLTGSWDVCRSGEICRRARVNIAKLISSLVTVLGKKKVLDVQKVFVTCLNKCGVELAILQRPYRGLPQLAVCKPMCASSVGILPSRRLNIVRLPGGCGLDDFGCRPREGS